MMTAMAIAMAMTERLRIYLLFERTFFFDIIRCQRYLNTIPGFGLYIPGTGTS